MADRLPAREPRGEPGPYRSLQVWRHDKPDTLTIEVMCAGRLVAKVDRKEAAPRSAIDAVVTEIRDKVRRGELEPGTHRFIAVGTKVVREVKLSARAERIER